MERQQQISSKCSERIICEIPLKLPSLNEYILVCRKNKYEANNFKQSLQDDIGIYLAKLPRFIKPIEITFYWIEQNKRRDLDNVCFAKKFILDAMVKSGKLADDNRRYVCNFRDQFFYGKESKVILEIKEAEHGAERIWDSSILGDKS